VTHQRHYTHEQATAALEWAGDVLRRMRAARDRLLDSEAREALSEASVGNGGGDPGRKVSEAFLELREGAASLREMEIVVRDLDRGLIDFPSLRDGREVYLCWQVDEPEIGHRHAGDTRLPLDPWL
jgi:hypothetical protein